MCFCRVMVQGVRSGRCSVSGRRVGDVCLWAVLQRSGAFGCLCGVREFTGFLRVATMRGRRGSGWGFYVALEGIDGAGKSSCQEVLARWLRNDGRSVLCVREPGGTQMGRALRAVVLSAGGSVSPWAEAALFAADRGHLVDEVVRPALSGGVWVVGDRSVYSSLAYQGAGRGLGVDAVESMNRLVMGDVWPDVVVVLEVDVDRGLGRQTLSDRIGAEAYGFMSDVAAAYRRLAEDDPSRVVMVDAGRPLEEVGADVIRVVDEGVRRVASGGDLPRRLGAV